MIFQTSIFKTNLEHTNIVKVSYKTICYIKNTKV